MAQETPLHQAARDEAAGQDVAARITKLLREDYDPHALDERGETAFNIAAANSPVTGRLMTGHWLEQALKGQGSKGLNDVSGSHGSTLAQYIAKWMSDDEMEDQVDRAIDAGMKIDVPNKSGWTPLTAAAAMGRVKAVEVFARHYSRAALSIKTCEEYKAVYGGCPVTYGAGLTAIDVVRARLGQDKNLTPAQISDYGNCVMIISAEISKR